MLLTTICARCRSAVIAEPLISSIPNKFMASLLHEWRSISGEIQLSAIALRSGNATGFRPATGLRVQDHCCHPDASPVLRLGALLHRPQPGLGLPSLIPALLQLKS